MSSNADLAGILHGEQDIIFHNPIPTEGRLSTEGAITHLYDKGADKGALVVAEAETYHSNGQKLFTNIFTLFLPSGRRLRRSDAPKDPVEFPDRAPISRKQETPSAVNLFCIVFRVTSSRCTWTLNLLARAGLKSRSCMPVHARLRLPCSDQEPLPPASRNG